MINSPPIQTPWGMADSCKAVAPGIAFYSTPSHGGYFVAPEWNKKILDRFPGFQTFCGCPGWYEEDCDWAAVAITFPEYFPTEAARHADQMHSYCLDRCRKAAA